MKDVLTIAAVGEILTGLTALLSPPILVRLLFGVEVDGSTIVMSRVAGIALIALGISCWPGPALAGMVTYGVLVTLYLGYLGIGGAWVGKLLWPAVAGHAILTVLLARAWLNAGTTAS